MDFYLPFSNSNSLLELRTHCPLIYSEQKQKKRKIYSSENALDIDLTLVLSG